MILYPNQLSILLTLEFSDLPELLGKDKGRGDIDGDRRTN
jgi:hypothetical protein